MVGKGQMCRLTLTVCDSRLEGLKDTDGFQSSLFGIVSVSWGTATTTCY